ncbi:MAG: SDR family oxidoreductase [Deltaproteobacteria bacterium]|nr:SDR family oxidoreductase [Deltaproteobacteria bacterium]
MNVKNKSVLITGGSRGLGRALALEFARAGARVALVARDIEPLRKVVAEIESQGGVAFAIKGDVGDKQAIYPMLGQASELAGPIDILINNASTLGAVPLQPLIDTDCESFEHALAVNTVGPFRLAKAVLGSMLVRGEGLVVNISSDAAVEAYPNWGIYSASKAALDHLTRVWAAELEGSGLHMISVDPGEMNTKMHADAIPDADPRTLANPQDVARRILKIVEGGSYAVRQLAARQSA